MESLHHSNQEYTAETSLELNTPDAEMLSKEKHQRLFLRGRSWLCVGVALMGISFGVNFLLFHSDVSFATTMYILTSLGMACMVKGIADILGF